MTITVGLVGRDITLDDPATFNRNGESVSMSGTLKKSEAEGLVLRDQIIGLSNNPDEPVVYVSFGGNYTRLDGFYAINGTSVEGTPGDGKRGIVKWSIDMERIASYQSAFLESRFVANVITNSHGIAIGTSIGVVGMQQVASEISFTFPGGIVPTVHTELQSIDYPSPTQIHVYGLNMSGFGSFNGFSAVGRWATDYSTGWYSGACKLQVGASFYNVVGRNMIDSPTSWRLRNDMVRVSPGASGTLDVQHWDGTQWDTAKNYTLYTQGGTAFTVDSFTHVSCIRNSPECSIIRVGLKSSSTNISVVADIMIRRGSRFVWIVYQSVSTLQYGVKRTTVEAATSITGGIRATSNDASGNRYIICGASGSTAFTKDTVNGGLYMSNVANAAVFGIGCELGGSGASTFGAAQNQAYTFFGNINETCRVVSR
jgi:hypothetical protein